jgi:RNA polymerase sigma-70 factor (ECF subfamily)
MDDQALVKQAQQGSAVAFEQLMRLHGGFVYNVALRTLSQPQEAEDITQEAFLQVLKSLSRFRGEAQFRTWLYRIVVNLCYARLPSLKQELTLIQEADVPEGPDERQSVDHIVHSADIRQQLLTAVEALPDGYRLLITLRHWQGLSYAEIADITGMPLGTVKTGIYRARRQLKLALRHLLTDGAL